MIEPRVEGHPGDVGGASRRGRIIPPGTRFSREDRDRVLRAVLLEPGDAWRLRFGVMLGLSVVIAATGLLADSPAVVIGAMLIAPLMTPVLGFAVALVLGTARSMLRLSATVLLASVGSIALAALLASILPADSQLTHEVVSRTAPSLLDLLVALAAGAAGAYATLREDVSAALPGVAVAVALVPPLATAGVTLQLGQRGLAYGALLLYAANLVAIVLASVIVLLAARFVPLPQLTQIRARVGASLVAVLAATVAIGALLSGGLRSTVDAATTLKAVNDEVVRWLGPNSDLEVSRVSVDGPDVTVELVGSQPPPPTSALVSALISTVGPDAAVGVRWSQRSLQTAPTTKPGAPSTTSAGNGELYRPLAEAWLAASPASPGSRVASLRLRGDELIVEVTGTSAPPPAKPLAAAVAASRGRDTKVTVSWSQADIVARQPPATAGDVVVRARAIVDSWARGQSGVVVLAVSVVGSAATVDLAAEATPAALDALVGRLRTEAGVSATVRLAPLTRIPTGAS